MDVTTVWRSGYACISFSRVALNTVSDEWTGDRWARTYLEIASFIYESLHGFDPYRLL